MKLMAHQEECIARCLTMPGGGFLNRSEPGTGKTIMTIAAMDKLAHDKKINRVLVICPNSVKNVWVDEIKKASSIQWNVISLDGHSEHRNIKIKSSVKPLTVLIINYESVIRTEAALKEWAPDLVVCDEAHLIKSHKAQRSKVIRKFKAKYRWALTGTPVTQSPLDVWSIIDWIRPGHLIPNFYAFRNRYCNIYTGAGFPVIKSYKNLDELTKKIDEVSYIARKDECLDLPDKQWITRYVELSSEEAKAYKAMASEMLLEVGEQEISASTALVKLLRLQQIANGFLTYLNEDEDEVGVDIGGSKMDALVELLEELDMKKVVVWCRFKRDVMRISQALVKMKRPHVTFTGDTSIEDRAKAISRFQADYDEKDINNGLVFVGTIQAGGVGITLTAASYMIYYSNSWSLSDRIQSSDRIHRIGQVHKCVYYDLIAQGTVDSRIHKILSSKEAIADKLSGKDLSKIIFDN